MFTKIDIHTSNSQPFVFLPTFINGRGPFEFVLDTGAGMSLLTEEIADGIGVENTETKEAIGAPGKKMNILIGTVKSLSVGEAKVENIQVCIMKKLPKCVGQGAIGYNFLKNFLLTIDYLNHSLSLTSSPGKESREFPGTGNIPLKLAKPDRPIILTDTVVNGKGIYQFILDTGASQTVLSAGLARELNLEGKENGPLIGAGGGTQSWVSTLKSLAVGDAHRENLAVMVADFFSALGQAAGTTIDGIIGYNFLNQFRVVIDYGNEVLRFEE